MAKGSHATWDPGQPRTCYVCGNPIRMTKDSAGFKTGPDRRFSWHTDCASGPPRDTSTLSGPGKERV